MWIVDNSSLKKIMKVPFVIQMRNCKLFTTKALTFFAHLKMPMSSSPAESKARQILDKAVQSVQPKILLENALKVSSSLLQIQESKIFINHNIHVVGFGKAVLGMAIAIEEILAPHIVSGIISVPMGIQFSYSALPSKIQVYEGALNNLPDEKSLYAASKISEFVASLDEAQLLLVLISGGGSALLPAPRPPLTLREKLHVISLLASKGATIEELNTVRKHLSTLKGGGLALLAQPSQVVGLILSDIIDDPLHLIASAPTVMNSDDPLLPVAIIDRYSLRSQIPTSALQILESVPQMNTQKDRNIFKNVLNFIVGNNETALNAAASEARSLGYNPFILTPNLRGTASTIGASLAHLASVFFSQEASTFHEAIVALTLPARVVENLKVEIMQFQEKGGKCCLLLGGETTVKVTGGGTGGRNQELALAAAQELSKCCAESATITILSAGTDGIDGPTSAAGAIATAYTVPEATAEGIDAAMHLRNNNSYNFFALAGKGRWHVKTGHTGTNVMDIVIILIETSVDSM